MKFLLVGMLDDGTAIVRKTISFLKRRSVTQIMCTAKENCYIKRGDVYWRAGQDFICKDCMISGIPRA